MKIVTFVATWICKDNLIISVACMTLQLASYIDIIYIYIGYMHTGLETNDAMQIIATIIIVIKLVNNAEQTI